MNHARGQKGGGVDESGDHRRHRSQDKAVVDGQHNEPVVEVELEGRVALVAPVG